MAAATKKSLQVPMRKVKETSGAWMFATEDDVAASTGVTNLYVKKHSVDKFDSAENVVVTISPA
jgi:hypothetical protein